MTDMLVKLYDTTNCAPNVFIDNIEVKIKRALAIDSLAIISFVKQQFWEICPGWIDECQASLYRQPSSCYIATYQGQVVGFCCYDGTAKGMLGPIGVDPAFQQRGIASLLLTTTFEAMKFDGYAYAVIGWVSSEAFYEKVCNAIPIPDSFPGVYQRMALEHE